MGEVCLITLDDFLCSGEHGDGRLRPHQADGTGVNRNIWWKICSTLMEKTLQICFDYDKLKNDRQ